MYIVENINDANSRWWYYSNKDTNDNKGYEKSKQKIFNEFNK